MGMPKQTCIILCFYRSSRTITNVGRDLNRWSIATSAREWPCSGCYLKPSNAPIHPKPQAPRQGNSDFRVNDTCSPVDEHCVHPHLDPCPIQSIAGTTKQETDPQQCLSRVHRSTAYLVPQSRIRLATNQEKNVVAIRFGLSSIGNRLLGVGRVPNRVRWLLLGWCLLLAFLVRWPTSLFWDALPQDPNTPLHALAAFDLASGQASTTQLTLLGYPDGLGVRLLAWPVLLCSIPFPMATGPDTRI